MTGKLVKVQRNRFMQDFGVAADELFQDADVFFEEEEGQPAIAADRIAILQSQTDSWSRGRSSDLGEEHQVVLNEEWRRPAANSTLRSACSPGCRASFGVRR